MYLYHGYYGSVSFDWTYIALIIAMFVSMIISVRVKTTFNKYAKKASRSGLTAEQAVQRMLNANGVYGVGIQRIGGSLTDNYNPKTNVISLSESVYGKNSVSAIGVACHEAGHALQYAEEYGPAKLRLAIVPVTNFGSRLSMPLLLIGLFLGFMELVWAGILLFSLSTFFQLVTLPVEFDASKRALAAMEGSGILMDDEAKDAKRVLSSAAMTYVAALATSVLMLLRYISIAKRRD
ncbi:MAG: zinc metallopeptidase [Clostridia bacterium]|nr:zinc metallopeptidase [Clostridia bacterium]MBQ7048644.1 zinc metallopeptidase [Clostridia bacterium]